MKNKIRKTSANLNLEAQEKDSSQKRDVWLSVVTETGKISPAIKVISWVKRGTKNPNQTHAHFKDPETDTTYIRYNAKDNLQAHIARAKTLNEPKGVIYTEIKEQEYDFLNPLTNKTEKRTYQLMLTVDIQPYDYVDDFGNCVIGTDY